MLFRSWIDCLFGDFRRNTGNRKQKKKGTPSRQSFAPALGVLRLERRRVLNGAPVHLDPTMLAHADSAPEANPNQAVTITVDAGKTDNVQTADVLKIARQGDRVEMFVNDSMIRSENASDTNGIKIDAGSNDLTLVLDFTGGNPIVPGGDFHRRRALDR